MFKFEIDDEIYIINKDDILYFNFYDLNDDDNNFAYYNTLIIKLKNSDDDIEIEFYDYNEYKKVYDDICYKLGV